jgi:hypothetical protein
MAMSKIENEIIKDMSKHFDNRLRKLIADTADICEIAGVNDKNVLKIVFTGLMYELVLASVVLNLDERDFGGLCQMAYREALPDVKKWLEREG